MLRLAWCSQKRFTSLTLSWFSSRWAAISSATIGQTSRNTLRPSWTNSLSRAPMPSSAARLRKPKLLRMLLENWVSSLVLTISNWWAEVAWSARSMTTAVAASPKMKWLSRSRKFRCPVQTSGLTIRIARAWPSCTLLQAAWMPKVAEEQATFMSKPNPWIPSAAWTSMAMAG